jgi:hypothetical protein
MIVSIDPILDSFHSVGLDQMDDVKLMNRTDTKFVFPVCKLPELLRLAKRNYSILEIDRERFFSYTTTYLDTNDYYFFCQQATNRPERHKVRYRTYESTGHTFLEVKRKTKKNRTIKWRIANNLLPEGCDQEALIFLNDFVPEESKKLRPVMTNRFTRITLVGLKTKERITIDYAISFSDENGHSIQLPYLAIAELKQEGYTNQSPFIRIAKQCHIRPSGFSKYCVGSALLYDLPKKNAFKRKFLLLNKVEHEYNNLFAQHA